MLPRQDKITCDQIHQVLDQHSDSGSQDSFLVATESHYRCDKCPEEWNKFLASIYTDLINEARKPHLHASRIDHVLSDFVRCSFSHPISPRNIVSDTRHLLRRLPIYSFGLPGKIPYMDQDYFHEPMEGMYWGSMASSIT